ncbi:MAG TPA: WD40 repeat domain-containing protein, partial [Chloroflexota bacterium]|nr:WD40 repeat domain-containing protein [Chloroflexota bacterium]
KTVAVGCGSGAVALWHWQSGTFTTLRGQTSFINAVAFSPDGTRVLTGSGDGTARIWDTGDGHLITLVRPDGSPIWSAAFSHDSNYIALGNEDDMASVWDARTGEQIAMLRGHTASVGTIEFSPDDREVITGGNDGTARVWDSGIAHPLTSWDGHSLAPLLNLHAQLATAAFSPDGTRLLVAGKNLWLYDTRTWRRLADIRESGANLYLGSAEFSPDGRYIVTEGDALHGNASYSTVWALHGSSIVRVRTSPKISGGLNIAPTFIPTAPYNDIVMATQDGHALVWNWRADKIVAVLPGVSKGKTMLPLAGAIAVALSGKSSSSDSQMNDAQFSPNGKLVATALGKTIEIWNWATGQRVGGPFRFNFSVENGIFSPNGQYLLGASNDDTAHVWKWQADLPLPPLVGDSNEVYNVAFSPDGSTALTASSDGTARLWDWQDGVDLMQLRGATAAVYDAEYSPNSKLIVTASTDGAVRVYSCDICGSPNDLVRLAAHRQP